MKKHLFFILVIISSIVFWLVNFNSLPAQIPVHWDLGGEPDGYSSKLGAFFIFNGFLIFMYLMMLFLPKIDPRKEKYKNFTKAYNMIIFTISLIFFLINIATVLSCLGYNVPIGKIVPILVGILFIVMGNYLPQVKSNYFMGIRTPWTLSNEDIWIKTHRLSGKICFVAGIVIFVSPFLPMYLSTGIIISMIAIVIIIPTAYSYFMFKKGMK
ncbi:SdpI family protein [Bacillus sp. RG28]|uniref:SdpI family protein n=1 Tax=Gottfriedia endophytica TaxID=2820819 RepID=A0A940SH63_9BACI|nr:SdpI family protein [Gottfriedia endophytica]MBP0725852.1 SdpI family protein [Gottfriedia endophytica]